MREERKAKSSPIPLFSKDRRHRLRPTENPRAPIRRREARHSARQAGASFASGGSRTSPGPDRSAWRRARRRERRPPYRWQTWLSPVKSSSAGHFDASGTARKNSPASTGESIKRSSDDGRKRYPVPSLVGDGHGTALLPVGREKNRRLDHQLALIDASRVENGGIPGKQDLMIGDGVFQQRIEVDGDLAGVGGTSILMVLMSSGSRVQGRVTSPEWTRIAARF